MERQMADESRKTVLITGTSSGIGEACVEALAADGWRVFAGKHREEDAIAGTPGAVTPLALDITSEGSIEAARDEIARAGGLDALVNNAGISGAGPVETVPMTTVRDVLETNLIGQFAVTQAFLPMLRASAGRIVFVSSLGGRVAFPYASPYHASKFGLEGLAESLRAEMVPFDVDVSLVEPGSMSTQIWAKGRSALADARARMDDEQRDAYGEALEKFDEQLAGQEDSEDPAEVAEVVVEALTASSPSDRYLVGRGAGALARVRPLIPAPLFDRIAQRVAGGGA
jgi:NAD(P)-dependent dehydrogenase (short-subunit alcohol dehydrogenase family)